MKLKVFLAGRVALESNGVVLEEERFPGRQGRLLFAYLVAEQGRPVPRDELADALWGEAPPATSDKALSVLASKLRGLLAGGGIDGGKALTSAFGAYRLSLPDGTWVDIIAAADALLEAEAALAADDFDGAKAAAIQAASLARPHFLPGEEGTWVEGKRRELGDVLRRALSCLAEASLRSGDPAEAVNWAEETIALEPYRETGYRQLMAAHAAAGNRAEALRVYERCRQLLATELGAYPSPETESIYRELLEAPPPGPEAAARQTAPVAVVERDPPSVESPAPRAAPRYLWRRRRVVIGVVAGLAAAVAIPLFALGGGGNRVNLGDPSNSVGVLDASSGAVRDAVGLGAAPTAVAVGLGYVWAASADANAVFAIDPKTNTVRQTIKVGNAPGGVAVGGGYVWVTNSLDGTVSQIDPEALIELQAIPVGNGPTGIASAGGHVWVANTLDHTVSKIRASDGKRLENYSAGVDPGAVAVGERAVWVASKSSAQVVKLDPRSGERQLPPISVGQVPAAILVALGSVWVANSVDGTVSQIDPADGSLDDVIPVGAGPSSLALVGDEVWTANELAATISRIDPVTGRTTPVRLASQSRPTAVAAAGNAAYAALRPAGATHRGGTLRLVLDGGVPLAGVDLAVGSFSDLYRFRSLTNDGLVAYRHVGGVPGYQLVPDLAASRPDISQDGKVYRFLLRPNVRYSNGEPVRASDFRHSIEREYMLRARTDPTASLSGILGAERCRPHRCNLAKGIEANDAGRTVTFHLSEANPYFLYDLASKYVVPADTPVQEATRRPLPATGPYRIESFTHRSIRLVRNPEFREWSKAAQPAGFPDEIALKQTAAQLGEKDPVALVEQQKADLTPLYLEFPSDPTLRPWVKPYPFAALSYLVVDTDRPPFDDRRARRAVSYAIDRNRLVQLYGSEGATRPACQVLPPNFPAHRPFCPYTLHPTAEGRWAAPDPPKAKRLVAASGTAGAHVRLWFPSGRVRVGRYVKEVLEGLGYRVTLRTSFKPSASFGKAYEDAKDDPVRRYFIRMERGAMSEPQGPQIAFGGWAADYPDASNFIAPMFSCRSTVVPSAEAVNYGRLCDRERERKISHAVNLQPHDPLQANRLWTELDREVTNDALVIPLVNFYGAELVSKRVGNYQYNPQYGALLSQLWVR